MKNNNSYLNKKGIVDQIILWIVLFVSFVTIFLLVIDYYTVIKVKDKCNALANYSVRMKALGKDTATIVAGLNSIKTDFFDTIVEADLTCTQPGTNDYKVILTTNITFTNKFLSEGEKIYSKATAFNEVDSTDTECSLNLRTP